MTHHTTPAPRPFAARPGFTLVELLVVIAIIALLIGILLPALGAARKTAQAVVCQSNIRQLAIANTDYAHASRNHYVWGAKDIAGPNLHRWHGTRPNENTAFDQAGSPLRDYFDSQGRIKECPAFSEYFNEAGQGAAYEAGCGGYGYNNAYIGSRVDIYDFMTAQTHTARADEVIQPTETILFADAAYHASQGMIAYSFTEPVLWDFGPGTGTSMGLRPNPSIHFRHLKTASIAWVDGHVSRRPMDFSRDYITHSLITGSEAQSLGLGWFGPDDSNTLFMVR